MVILTGALEQNSLPNAVEVEQALSATVTTAQNENFVGEAGEGEVSSSVQKARNFREAAHSTECGDTRGSRGLQIALYNLQLENIPTGMGTLVTESLLAEVRKLQGVEVVGMEEIMEMLEHEKTKAVMGCDDDSCLAEIAGALGVDEIITGRMTEQADGRVLVVRRISQRRATVVGTVNQRLKIGNGEEFLLAIGPAVKKLYPNRKLRPGTQRGVARKVLLRMNPPPLPTWATYTALGTTAVFAALSGVLLLAGDAALASRDEMLTASAQEPMRASELRERDSQIENIHVAATAGWVSCGALLLGSAIMSMFTDWEGYGQSSQSDTTP